MSGFAIAILVIAILLTLLFAAFQIGQAAAVRVDSGTVGLMIVRGVATERSLEPGLHFVMPYRKYAIQGYPLREMTYLTVAGGVADETDYADELMRVRLGDRTLVAVGYTVRFKIRPDGLPTIHERVGMEGIKRLVRDESQRAVTSELGKADCGIDDVFGVAREQLEATIGARVAERLLADGFDTVLFAIREIDLGTVGEVVDATVRAKAELDLERAAAAVRALRIEHDSATEYDLGTLTADVLRYRQIELGREAVQRWDGRSVVGESRIQHLMFPDTTPLVTPPATAAADAPIEGA